MTRLGLLVTCAATLFALGACKSDESAKPKRDPQVDERVCVGRRATVKGELDEHRARLADLKTQLVTAQKVVEAARTAKDELKATQADLRTQELSLRINEEEKIGQTIEARRKDVERDCAGL